MNSATLTISVVIPSTSEALPVALETALAGQTLVPHELIHIYDRERRGAAWSRNRGIEQATGDVVACIDDDCIPPANWLASIAAAFFNFDADVVGGTYDECDPFLRARRSRHDYPTVTGPDTDGQVGTGGNIAYRKKILDRIRARNGYVFNESFRISQDWELIWRLRDLGATVVFLATAVQHVKYLSTREYLRQQFYRGIGIAKLDQVRRGLNATVTTHQSLLWSDPGEARLKTLARIFWYKGIGPFDRNSFTSTRHFLRYWMGEKLQSAGYLWGKWRLPKIHSSSQPTTDELHYPLPRFSVIIESENLAVEDPEFLYAALDSLSGQSVAMARADDAILINSGRIPPDIEAKVRTRYPWLRLHSIDSNSNYYEAKQNPVSLTTGEIVVFCDCDCRYSVDWLQSMLAPYVDPEINADVVTGETSVSVSGFQSILVALAWCFPPHSERTEPYATNGYAANNVSFRRTLLEEMPIPTDLGIYRGNCSLHARQLMDAGITIWKSPGARAFHPVLRMSHMPARFFMWGHHEAKVCREKHRRHRNRLSRAGGTIMALAGIIARRVAMPFVRWPTILRRHPLSVFYVPPLVCYIALADVLFIAGAITTLVFPSMSLLKLAGTLEASEHN